MKKILKIAFAVVAFAAVGLSSYKSYGSYTAANDMSEEDLLLVEDVLALSDPKPKRKVVSDRSCYNGGPGSTSCSIEAGIQIAGYGVSGGGSVSCESGMYACCGLSCTCKPNYI